MNYSRSFSTESANRGSGAASQITQMLAANRAASFVFSERLALRLVSGLFHSPYAQDVVPFLN
jgi:hypothetical protein